MKGIDKIKQFQDLIESRDYFEIAKMLTKIKAEEVLPFEEIKNEVKMDTKTGQIVKGKDLAELQKMIQANEFLEAITPKDMTEKQEKMQVSKYDKRSKLGKKFTESRQVRRRKEREENKRLRSKLSHLVGGGCIDFCFI